MVVSSDYDSTHEANHSDSSDVAHTEEDTEEGKSSSQNVILHQLIPPEVAEGCTGTTKTQSSRHIIYTDWRYFITRHRTDQFWLQSHY